MKRESGLIDQRRSRFTRNNFADEKNHTIVTFPIKNLEMKDYVLEAAPLDGVASNIPETIDGKNIFGNISLNLRS